MDHCEGGWVALWGGIVVLKVRLRRPHLIPCVLHLLIFVGREVTALVRRLAKSVRPRTRVSV